MDNKDVILQFFDSNWIAFNIIDAISKTGLTFDSVNLKEGHIQWHIGLVRYDVVNKRLEIWEEDYEALTQRQRYELMGIAAYYDLEMVYDV